MKKYIIWIIILVLLICIWIVRILSRAGYRPKFLFKNKQVIQIEYKDPDNKDIVLKNENNNWYVITPSRKYNADKTKFDTLLEKINNFKLLEIVSKEKDSFTTYNVDENNAFKVKIVTKQKPVNTILWLGKTGGFTYDEIYVRVNNRPEVYLAKGLLVDDIKKRFYEYCNKTILKSKIDNINFIQVKTEGKTYQYKKELKDSTTVWINLKTAKQVDYNKVDNYLRFFDEFVGDSIVEPVNFDFSQLKLQVETLLKYDDGTEVVLYFYDKIPVSMPEQWGADISITYPVKIKSLTPKGQSVDVVAEEDIVYGIYDFRYKDFKEMPTKF